MTIPRDHSRSRAVLLGVWQYSDPQLPDIPAADHSLAAMKKLLTGPLCGWPGNRVLAIANRRRPGNLHDKLVELFADTADDATAIFYFVGHGLTDSQGRLCLALGETRSQPSSRRASTSLQFGIVRDALLEACRDGTRIVILDCCYAGLSVREPATLSPEGLLEMTYGTGAYTMCASGAYEKAWYETDVAGRPMTYFTKYLLDVVSSGMPDQPAELTLDQVFARTRDNLLRDHKPEPTHTARHDAGRFPLARNRTPAVPAVDLAAENQRLRAKIAALEEQTRKLHKQEAEDDRRLELLARSSASEDELASADRQAGETVRAIAATAAERERLAAKLTDTGTPHAAVPESPLILHGILTGEPEDAARLVEQAARRPIPEVAELASALRKTGKAAPASSLAQQAVRMHPPAEVAELVRRISSAPLGRYGAGIRTAALREAAALPVTDVRDLVSRLDHYSARILMEEVGQSSSVSDIGWLAGELQSMGANFRADQLLSAASTRTTDLPELIADLSGRGDHAGILMVLKTPRAWNKTTRQAVAGKLHETSLSPWAWRSLLRGHAWYLPHTEYGRNWLAVGAAVCLFVGVSVLSDTFDRLSSGHRLTGHMALVTVLFTASLVGLLRARVRLRHTGELSWREPAISAGLIGLAFASIPIAWIYQAVGTVVLVVPSVLLVNPSRAREAIAWIHTRLPSRTHRSR
jgi:hypothetical protein